MAAQSVVAAPLVAEKLTSRGRAEEPAVQPDKRGTVASIRSRVSGNAGCSLVVDATVAVSFRAESSLWPTQRDGANGCSARPPQSRPIFVRERFVSCDPVRRSHCPSLVQSCWCVPGVLLIVCPIDRRHLTQRTYCVSLVLPSAIQGVWKRGRQKCTFARDGRRFACRFADFPQ